MNDEITWWENKRHERFRFIEDEHSCCIKPEDSIEYTKEIVTIAEYRERERIKEVIEGMKKSLRADDVGQQFQSKLDFNAALEVVLKKI